MHPQKIGLVKIINALVADKEKTGMLLDKNVFSALLILCITLKQEFASHRFLVVQEENFTMRLYKDVNAQLLYLIGMEPHVLIAIKILIGVPKN